MQSTPIESGIDPSILEAHPYLLWLVPVLIVSSALVVVSERVQKVLGPFGRWITSHQQRGIERKSKELEAWGEFNSVLKAALREEVAGLKLMLDDERTARAADRIRHSDEIAGLRAQLDDAMREIQRLSALVERT